jgi:hypothetical protein
VPYRDIEIASTDIRSVTTGLAVEVANGKALGVAAELPAARLGVNHCGERPNKTSDFDTIGHAPAPAI